PDPIASWDVTSDSYALMLARRLGAEGLLVVKSCAVDRACSPAELSAAGVLDRRFPALAQDATLAIELLGCDELERARELLIGNVRVGA
ncbi:MAG TPA: aspartate kinase, partial [Ideonella sp.]|nr:aspartate kinase [Ideonella sp.]